MEASIQVSEAVEAAKKCVNELFGTEGVSDIGLEELEYDESSREWLVTIGFSRPWDRPAGSLGAIAQAIAYPRRSYKIVRISDATGKVRAVKNREVEP